MLCLQVVLYLVSAMARCDIQTGGDPLWATMRDGAPQEIDLVGSVWKTALLERCSSSAAWEGGGMGGQGLWAEAQFSAASRTRFRAAGTKEQGGVGRQARTTQGVVVMCGRQGQGLGGSTRVGVTGSAASKAVDLYGFYSCACSAVCTVTVGQRYGRITYS